MLKTIRIILALICFVAISLLFLDLTGTLAGWFGFLAKWQFMPALLSVNVAVIVAIIAVTLLSGRLYCSILCPLGVMQDIISWINGRRGRKQRRRFAYRPQAKWLRWSVTTLFALLLLFGMARIAALIEPYSAFGRIMAGLVKPLYVDANNLIADSVAADNYTFYHVDYFTSSVIIAIASITLLVVGVMAWLNGRLYCNTICPVGTLLGLLSRHAWLRPVIDHNRCVKCGLCEKECKSSCINSKEGIIDYSRCVACMDCINSCHTNAITFAHKANHQPQPEANAINQDRREMLTVSALLAGTAIMHAADKTVDGGLATIIDKQKPKRTTPITPPGSLSHDNFARHCTACQLCIARCPNNVLRPNSNLESFMQPEVSYERGYCRPECVECSSICPTGAIRPIDVAQKSATGIGHAVWIRNKCLPVAEGVSCGNCARHCPAEAITMVSINPNDRNSLMMPAINTERCIGCGACENLCPVRPFSAIYIEGHERHNTI